MHVKTIKAEAVLLALVARQARSGTRWAAMSAHTHTTACNTHGTPARVRSPSMLSPMSRGDLWRCVDRVRSKGRREVLATFGIGIRALEADIAHPSMRA